MLDAPVSGGKTGAATRNLAVMVGGDRTVYDRVKPVLDAIGDKVFYAGAIGAGSVCKLVHNMVGHSVRQAVAEALTLGVKAGVEAEAVWEGLRRGALGRMHYLHEGMPKTVFRGEYDPPMFSLALARKDIGLATELGPGVRRPVAHDEPRRADRDRGHEPRVGRARQQRRVPAAGGGGRGRGARARRRPRARRAVHHAPTPTPERAALRECYPGWTLDAERKERHDDGAGADRTTPAGHGRARGRPAVGASPVAGAVEQDARPPDARASRRTPTRGSSATSRGRTTRSTSTSSPRSGTSWRGSSASASGRTGPAPCSSTRTRTSRIRSTPTPAASCSSSSTRVRRRAGRPIYEGRFNMTARKRIEEENVEV